MKSAPNARVEVLDNTASKGSRPRCILIVTFVRSNAAHYVRSVKRMPMRSSNKGSETLSVIPNMINEPDPFVSDLSMHSQ
jgi:hypothetical protein